MNINTLIFIPTILLCGIYLFISIIKNPWIGIWLFFLSCAFSDLLTLIRLPSFGGSGLTVLDIISVFIFIAIALRICTREEYRSINTPKHFYFLILFFIYPVVIGIIRKYNVFTVFRDARTILEYAMLIPLYFVFVTDYAKLKQFLRHIIYFSIIAMLICWLMAFLGIKIYGEHRYVYGANNEEVYTWWGLFSWHMLYLFSTFYILTRINLRQEKYKKLFIVILFFLIYTIISFLSRGMFLALVSGILYTTVMLSIKFKQNKLLILFSILFFLLIVIFNLPINVLKRSNIIARYGSMVYSDLSYSGAEGTIIVRKKALELYKNNKGIYRLIGSGYGDTNFIIKEIRGNKLIEMMNHSAWGWALLRLGVLGTTLYVIIILIFVKPFKIKHSIDLNINIIPLQASIISLMVEGFGANTLFGLRDYHMFFVLLLAAVISLNNAEYIKSINEHNNGDERQLLGIHGSAG